MAKKIAKKKSSDRKVSRKKAISTHKNSRKKVSKKSQVSKKAHKQSKGKLRKRFIFRKLFLIFLIPILLWTIYLDFQIKNQFEGKRWALPAQVYGRPMELFPGKTLSSRDFRQELEVLGYRNAYRVQEPGTFHQSEARYRVFLRGFQFWDGSISPHILDIHFADNQIEKVRDVSNQQDVDLIRLEPPRIGGIYPTHHEDRVLVKIEDVPDQLLQGLVAVEDHQYYEHFGVNPRAILRALWANVRAGATVQGGSTLTQQLVKNFFLTNKRNLWRKGNEAIMSLLLEWHYDKNEIFEAYLNEIYLGQQNSRAIHGFGLASQYYFDRDVDNLELDQIATLIALVRGPSYYDPQRHPKRLKKRRDLVLNIMFQRGVIDEDEAMDAKSKGMVLVNGRRRQAFYPAYMDLVRRQLKRDYRLEDLNSEGLRIFTAFDPLVQHKAEQALSRRSQQLDKQYGLNGKLQGAVIVTDVTTGEVLAVVGDRNAKFSGFNRALDAVRPIGSLIKPMIYLTALEHPERYTLVSPLDDSVINIKAPNGDVWSPKNYNGKSHGTVPLFAALVHSYNQSTVRLGMALGFEPIIDVMQRLGAKRNIPPYPSMLLGSTSFTPYEVTEMYQTIASGGFHSDLRVIREVTDIDSKPLRRFPLDVEEVVDAKYVALLVSAMQEVTKTGTARRLQKTLPSGMQVAGKTGTSNDLRDSWYAGFNGQHLAVVWMGMDNNHTSKLTGSSGALGVWSDLFSNMPGISLTPVILDSINYQWVDRKTGLLSGETCQDSINLAFINGTQPLEQGACGKAQTSEKSWFKSLFD
jgi:penicillin-binding protein 1B